MPIQITSYMFFIQAHASKYLKALEQCVDKNNAIVSQGLLSYMRIIGASKPELLLPHEGSMEKLLEDPALKEQAQGILDIMEGRT